MAKTNNKTEKWLKSWLKIKATAYANRCTYDHMTVGALIGNLDEIYKQALGHLKEVNDGSVRRLKEKRRELKVAITNHNQQHHAKKSKDESNDGSTSQ